MAIVAMKRLHAVCLSGDAPALLRALTAIGSVEVERGTPEQLADWGESLHLPAQRGESAAKRQLLERAAVLLSTHAPPKKASLFSPRTPITTALLYQPELLASALLGAKTIDALGTRLGENSAEIARLEAQRIALAPWLSLDLPLDWTGSRSVASGIGMLPAAAALAPILEKLSADAPTAIVTLLGADREQQYLWVLVHRKEETAAFSHLKANGFAPASFPGSSGTPQEYQAKLTDMLAALAQKKEALLAEIRSYAPLLPQIQQAMDAFAQEAVREELLAATIHTGETAYLQGWVPVDRTEPVGKILTDANAAYAFADPAEGEEPPVLMQTSRLVDPVVGITEMYGVPAYDSLIDPNPSMFPFYIMFFGLIMQDVGYGVLMFFGCWAALRLMRPAKGLARMLRLFMYCGVSTAISGALFGGWFADSLPVFTETFFGKAISIPPLWFNPLDDPMKMLVFSLALGAVHILTGMALSAYRMLRKGDVAGAVFDVGSWYVLFFGIGFAALGFSFGTPLIVAGLLLLLLTGGRAKKGLVGKLFGGLGAIYGGTSYLSDLLSYSRIMALGLSGAVVGQVMNKIGTLAGGGVLGMLLFVVIFLLGHTFNLAISILGAYVHTSRLQYIEYFGRFFEEGGRLFHPLQNNTKFVEIVEK